MTMKLEIQEIFTEATKVMAGAVTGLVGGMWAEKKAAKSAAIQELQMLKTEYREFATTMKGEVKDVREELDKSRAAEEECHQQHRLAMNRIDELDRCIREVTKIPPKPKPRKPDGK